MDYSAIVANHTKTYIENIRKEIQREVIAEFCAKNKIENPYLTREEMDALATDNGTVKPKRFTNCPDNIFISPNSIITFAGYLVKYDIDVLYETKLLTDKTRKTVTRERLEAFSKIYHEILLQLRYSNANGTNTYSLNGSEYNVFEHYANYYYVNTTLYRNHNKDFAFMIAYPKYPTRMLSRYFIEFARKEDPDVTLLPFAIKYDFYIQERMGFINTFKTSKISEMGEMDEELINNISKKNILLAHLTSEAKKKQEEINLMNEKECALKVKISTYLLEISNLEINLAKKRLEPDNSDEKKLLLAHLTSEVDKKQEEIISLKKDERALIHNISSYSLELANVETNLTKKCLELHDIEESIKYKRNYMFDEINRLSGEITKKTEEFDKRTEEFKKESEEFDRMSAIKTHEIERKEQEADIYLETTQKYRKDVEARLNKREEELNIKSVSIDKYMDKNFDVIKDSLTSICEEMLILINVEESTTKLNEIKRRLIRIYGITAFHEKL
jgi:hypothetical protein